MEETIAIPKPKICCVDLAENVYAKLSDSGYTVFDGTLGNISKVPNKKERDKHFVLLDNSYPLNFHEYDILIIDLTAERRKDFSPVDFNRDLDARGKSIISLVCSFPTTIFDPRPIGSSMLGTQIRALKNKKFIQIVFASEDYEIEYEILEVTNDRAEGCPSETHSIYSFDKFPLSEIRHGKEAEVCEVREDMYQLLNKHVSKLIYAQTFYHPTNWEKEKGNVPVSSFMPLIKNVNDEIISYIDFEGERVTFVFPNFNEKDVFLEEFLGNILPSIYPELFPYSAQFDWLKETEYFLPNHKNLLTEKNNLTEDYNKALSSQQQKIIENNKKYYFLHEMLIETGDKLVQSIYSFLKWLEFKSVIIKDEESTSIKEEDLQLELENGILVIETKGIGGTSTDSDCSQISKIKHRRCEDRNAFDVYALYIVNHQRHLPPMKRRNPPFSEHQIKDAQNDKRGLLTTWQLFKLYHTIQNNIITKEEARKQFVSYGNIIFKPKLGQILGKPKELFNDGHVAILDIIHTKIRKDDTLIVEKNDTFLLAKILNIQVNGNPVLNAENGEVGIKLDIKIVKGSILWTH